MPFDANDPDTKTAIAAAVEAAVEAAKGPLDQKNKQLLDELKEARRGKTIDPAEVEKLNDRIDELSTKLTTAEKAAKDAAKETEKATKALEQESGFTHRLVAENGLLKALADNGVTDPAYLEAAKAMHIGAVKIVSEGDARKALYGDKPLEDAIKEWAGTDAGKKFVAAPVNGGGGAPGGKGGSEPVKTMLRSTLDAMTDPKAKMEAAKTHQIVDETA